MHPMFIPAITVTSWFKKSYFTYAAPKGGCDSFRNNSTLCWEQQGIFMQHMSYLCKHKKHGSGWCIMFSVYYILLNL